MTAFPKKQGLYDPAFEKDSCGVGFVMNMKGEKSHEIITQGLKILKKLKPGQNGEIHITDAIRALIHQNNKFIGHVFAGKYLDCGTMQGYVNSFTEISKL